LRESCDGLTVNTRDAAFSAPSALTRVQQEVDMLGRIGVLGFLGIIVFVAWAIGWIFFNLHDWHYHLLFLAAVVLMIAQGVNRVAR
jgi:hypothetical protein